MSASTLDGRGEPAVHTGIGFFDHMLDALARHALLDLTVEAQGDLHVDGHHTVEDTGIALGMAIARALGDRAGIRRYADALVPLDEALVRAVVDVSGRPVSVTTRSTSPSGRCWATTTSSSLRSSSARWCSMPGSPSHMDLIRGDNPHHIVEAAFKAFARALDGGHRASIPRVTGVPSTKGAL